MRFLNPKTDFAFKRIFGSDASRDLLVSFLNAVLSLEGSERIAEVTILDPYQAPRIKGWKDTFVDVRARDRAGRTFIVEMQVLVAPGLEKRILYNACKAYVGQIQRADDYRQLIGVIAITITDFVMYRELEGIVSTFRLSAAENPELVHEDMALVFVELPKFTKGEADLTSALDRWLYFLRTAETLEAVPAALAADPAIGQAFEIANRAGLSPEELHDQEMREQWIGFQKSLNLDAGEARREGKAEGLAVGKAEGLAEGKAEGLAEGEQKGRAEMLLRLLRRRFGTVPVAVVEQVQAAGIDHLDEWSENVLDAATLEDVFYKSRPQ